MAQLPPAQREVVTLRDIEGFAADEVCQLLDLTDANQRVLLHRGRSKVRAALEEYVAARRVALDGGSSRSQWPLRATGVSSGAISQKALITSRPLVNVSISCR